MSLLRSIPTCDLIKICTQTKCKYTSEFSEPEIITVTVSLKNQVVHLDHLLSKDTSIVLCSNYTMMKSALELYFIVCHYTQGTGLKWGRYVKCQPWLFVMGLQLLCRVCSDWVSHNLRGVSR